MTIFSERLRNLRRIANLSQEELAERADTRTNTISRYELGKTASPKREALAKLAEALNTTTSYLLGETDNPTREGQSTVQIIGVGANVQNIGNQDSNFGNVNMASQQREPLPWWVVLPQDVYCTAQSGNTQDIEAALDALRAATRIIERAQAAMACESRATTE